MLDTLPLVVIDEDEKLALDPSVPEAKREAGLALGARVCLALA